MSKKLDAPHKSGPAKAWLKNQKSEITGNYPRHSWNVLTIFFLDPQFCYLRFFELPQTPR